MGVSENNKVKRKGHKIVVQIGAIIIVLFTIVTLEVGNMVTMASFSTALSTNMTMFENYMDTIASNMGNYKALTWLMDYWRDNADDLLEDESVFKKKDNIDDILDKLSKETAMDITATEADSLPAEDQKRFAIWCYNELTDTFRMYHGEDDEIAIILTLTDNEKEPFVLLTNAPEEEGILLGGTGDVEEIQKIIANTQDATKAEVWKWAFTTPEKLMFFGTKVPVDEYKGSSTAEMLGGFEASLVYEDMEFTDHIRNEVIVMMLIVLILILIGLYFIVPRPLAMVKKCVSEYSDTKNTDELVSKLSAIRSKNEIGAFADEFSALALEMERYTREMEVLAGERERVATELNVATNIQMQMLPHVFPENEKFKLHASSLAAKEVGGDFYDCYMIDDDHLALTIADVSGKGVPAALFMAVSKTMLKNRTIVGGTPSNILHDVNNWLCEGNDSCMFVTVWHGILTISTGELVCTNAGHENPGIRANGAPFRLIRTEHGVSLGLMEDMEFEDEHYVLSSGDAVFVYTDGIPEAHSSDESMFGEDRLESVLSAVSKDDMPQDIMKKVSDAVDEFADNAAQYDDLTMLCLIMN